jgi:hypothetical protein
MRVVRTLKSERVRSSSNDGKKSLHNNGLRKSCGSSAWFQFSGHPMGPRDPEKLHWMKTGNSESGVKDRFGIVLLIANAQARDLQARRIV